MPIDPRVVIDCADPHGLADFWAAALGYAVENHSANLRSVVEAGRLPSELVTEVADRLELRDYAAIRHPDDQVHPRTGVGQGRRLLFQRVPEPRTVKNRLHLDLHVERDTREAEVERLVALGATVLREVDEPLGRWSVLADPEGNEFCVL